MKTLIITKKDLDKDNYYCGKENLSDYSNPFNGHIEIAESLGTVGFKTSLVVAGSIVAKAGSGITAGEGITAGWGIKAGYGIACKLTLSFKYRLFAGVSVYRDKSNEIKTITCGKLEGGTVCYGEVIETGLPEDGRKSDLLAKADELIAKANELKAEAEKLT